MHHSLSEFANMDLACSCGKRHRVPIQAICTGCGSTAQLEEIAAAFRGKHAFLVGDSHTKKIADARVREMLAAAGVSVTEYCFERRGNYLTDETAIGEYLVALPPDTDLIVAIGSGTMNDLTRVISARCRIPYIIIATAPSMDGYASSTSAVIVGPRKVSVPLGTPWAIIADTDNMIGAPDEMISSGIGDVLGKYTTLLDWRLAAREGEEHFCPVIADLIQTACRRCQTNYRRVLARETDAVGDMADTLVMAGVAISMFGTSRPASGSEHQLAHYWEVESMKRSGTSGLHGNYVGLGAIASILLYQLAGQQHDFSDLGYPLPPAEDIRAILAEAGGYALEEKLNIDRTLFLESFTHAARNNDRYTLLTYLDRRGELERYARQVTDLVFGKA